MKEQVNFGSQSCFCFTNQNFMNFVNLALIKDLSQKLLSILLLFFAFFEILFSFYVLVLHFVWFDSLFSFLLVFILNLGYNKNVSKNSQKVTKMQGSENCENFDPVHGSPILNFYMIRIADQIQTCNVIRIMDHNHFTDHIVFLLYYLIRIPGKKCRTTPYKMSVLGRDHQRFLVH